MLTHYLCQIQLEHITTPTIRQALTDLNRSSTRLHALLWVTTAPGNQAVTTMLHKLDLPTPQDQRKQHHLSFFCL